VLNSRWVGRPVKCLSQNVAYFRSDSFKKDLSAKMESEFEDLRSSCGTELVVHPSGDSTFPLRIASSRVMPSGTRSDVISVADECKTNTRSPQTRTVAQKARTRLPDTIRTIRAQAPRQAVHRTACGIVASRCSPQVSHPNLPTRRGAANRAKVCSLLSQINGIPYLSFRGSTEQPYMHLSSHPILKVRK